MNNFKVLMNGIVKENPTFVLLLGMCWNNSKDWSQIVTSSI